MGKPGPNYCKKQDLTPSLPADWEAFKMHYRYGETFYHIAVLHTHAGNGEMSVTVDGVEQRDKAIPLVDDRQEHYVEVQLRTEQLFGSVPDIIAQAKTEQP